MMNVQGELAPAKQQKILKKFENSSTKTHRTIHELADTIGISYGVCQEILTENLNMRLIARPHVPENYRVCD
jgi:hypothetical protein